jgi:hypothetical protein
MESRHRAEAGRRRWRREHSLKYRRHYLRGRRRGARCGERKPPERARKPRKTGEPGGSSEARQAGAGQARRTAGRSARRRRAQARTWKRRELKCVEVLGVGRDAKLHGVVRLRRCFSREAEKRSG